ncbi:MAPEG family protein [Maricaulis sp. D1M11]|uniref:MAPEG family protein n=1 Tax=Maricaulis sp. D1M11 TaxID=3076117 RepID=UPI0039B37ECC
MTFELWMALAAAGLLFLAVNYQAVIGIGVYGLIAQIGPRDGRYEFPNVIGRGQRAVRNHIEAMAMFIPVVLIAHLAGISNEWTRWGALTFILCRTLYLPAYWSGIPAVRTLLFSAGLMSTVAIALPILLPSLFA